MLTFLNVYLLHINRSKHVPGESRYNYVEKLKMKITVLSNNYGLAMRCYSSNLLI